MLLVVSLVGVEHTVEPREQLLGTVVRVEDNWDTIVRSDGSDVVGGSDGSGDGGLLVPVGKTLTTEKGGSTLGDLEDDGRVDVSGSLEDTVDDGRRGDVLTISPVRRVEWVYLQQPKRAKKKQGQRKMIRGLEHCVYIRGWQTTGQRHPKGSRVKFFMERDKKNVMA